MGKGTVVVKFLGDSSQFNRTLGGVEGRLGRMGGTFARVGRLAGAALGGAVVAGVGAAGYALYDGAKNAAALQQILGQTKAVLKSTGGAAGVSAKQVRSLANEINNYSTLDDDAVQSGENLLLTFTNIQNKVGKGNDIFTRATKTMADMSTALGEDTKSAAIQLGKALNDPIKGVTALQRVGVSFTQQQKNQIAKLVASGKTMKAQKLILHELNKEFGGSAKAAGKTFSGALFHLKDALSDMLRDAIMPLLPGLTKVARWLGRELPGAFKSAISWVKNLIGHFSGGGGVMDAAGGFIDILKSLASGIGKFISTAGPPLLSVLKSIAGFVRDDVVPVLEGLGTFISGTLAPALGGVLKAAFNGLKSGIDSIRSAIQAHRSQLASLLKAFAAIGRFLINVLAPVLRTVLPIAFKILGKVIALAITIIAGVVKVFKKVWDAVKAVADFFTGPFLHAIGVMVSVFVKGVSFLSNAALTAFGVIVHGGSTMLGWVPGIGGKLKSAARAFDIFRDQVNSTLSGLASDAGKWGTKGGTAYGNNFKGAAEKIVSAALKVPKISGYVDTGSGHHGPTNNGPGQPNHNGGPGGHPTLTADHPTVVLHVHNPIPEKASDSIPRQLRKAQFLRDGMAWAG